jgi:hypothetical protein
MKQFGQALLAVQINDPFFLIILLKVNPQVFLL